MYTTQWQQLFVPQLFYCAVLLLLTVKGVTAQPGARSTEINAIEAAQSLLDQHHVDSAVMLVQNALEKFPLSEEAPISSFYVSAADIYRQAGRLGLADSLLMLAKQQAASSQETISAGIAHFDLLRQQGNLPQAEVELEKVRQAIGSDTLSENMARYYLELSRYYLESRDIWPSLNYLHKALAIPFDNPVLRIRINHNMAIVYESISGLPQALSIYEENLELSRAVGYEVGEMYAFYAIANLQLLMDELEEAKGTCREAIVLYEQGGAKKAFGYVYFLLGWIHRIEEQLDSSAFYFRKGIDLSKTQMENKELGDNLSGMAITQFDMGNTDSAYYYMEEARAVQTFNDLTMTSLEADIWAKRGDFEAAYHYLKDYQYDIEFMEQDETNYEIVSSLLAERFEQEKVRDREAFQQELESERLRLGLMVLGLGLFVLGYFLYQQVRNARQQKIMNLTLQQRNEALTQFAYITSHDLKEPIRNVSTFAGLLERQLSERVDTKAEQDYLHFIKDGAQTLYQIVESLKIFTEISFGKVERHEVNLLQTFESLQSTLTSILAEKNGQLTFRNPHELRSISFSQPMLLLVLQNLIQNGLKYNSSTKRRIEVNVKPQGEKTRFEVVDNGDGIASEYHANIFQPFKTLANKTANQSSGLGLAICKTIVENYEGEMGVQSEVGEGSVFYFVV